MRLTRLNLRTVKRHERGKMNATEQKFAQLLETHLRTESPIFDVSSELFPVVPFKWLFEKVSLTLADNTTTYRPDFYVLTTRGQLIFFEVKARTNGGKVLWQDAGRVKFKVAANLYPEFRFIAASFNAKTGWQFEEIEP